MNTKRISADEARSLRQDHMAGDSDVMYKASPSAPSSWNSGARSARFVMTSQNKDRYGDVVVTNGINTALFDANPVALLSHNSRGWPIGDWKNVEKITRGKPPRMEGDLVLHKSGGPIDIIDQAAWMIEHGYMRGASIGFVPNFSAVEMLLDDSGEWTGGLKFNEAELVECSLCTVPANPDALAKLLDGDVRLARELLEDVLDNWQRSPEGVLVPRAEFERAYKIIRTRQSVRDKAPATVPDMPCEECPDPTACEANGTCMMGQEGCGKKPKKAAAANWKCGCSRDLPIGQDGTWDGAAAASAMLDAAGIGGDNPDPTRASKGFLVHDSANPELRGSYKLPFADIVGGTLTAMPAGLRAAASRLPQTDVPQSVKDAARAVIDHYQSRMDNKALLAFAERSAAMLGMRLVEQKRIEAIESAATANRLRDARRREAALRTQKIEALRIRS